MNIKPISDSKMIKNSTTTSKFVKFLITVCFIPISIKDDIIKLGFFTRRNIFHIIVYYGAVGALFASYEFVNDQPSTASNGNPIENVAAYLSYLCNIQMICPILLSSKGNL